MSYSKRSRRSRRRTSEKVGELVRSASDNRSALDRERNRWLAMKRDVARYVPTDDTAAEWPDFRTDWRRDFYAWENFYRSNYDNVMGDVYPLSDLQSEIDEWAEVLNRWRSRFSELTGTTPSEPVMRSGRRSPVGPSTGLSVGTLVLGGAALVGLGLALSRS